MIKSIWRLRTSNTVRAKLFFCTACYNDYDRSGRTAKAPSTLIHQGPSTTSMLLSGLWIHVHQNEKYVLDGGYCLKFERSTSSVRKCRQWFSASWEIRQSKLFLHNALAACLTLSVYFRQTNTDHYTDIFEFISDSKMHSLYTYWVHGVYRV